MGVAVELGAGGVVDKARRRSSAAISGGDYGVWAPGGSSTTVINGGSITGTNIGGIVIAAEWAGDERSGATIIGAAGVSIGGSGTVTNSGTVSATAGNAVAIGSGGSASNASGRSITGVAGGVIITGASGTVTNSGAVAASSRARGRTGCRR